MAAGSGAVPCVICQTGECLCADQGEVEAGVRASGLAGIY